MDTNPYSSDSTETLLRKILTVVKQENSSSWGSITGTITNQSDLTTYIQTLIAAALVSVVKKQGGINCGGNPDFPEAVSGDLYFVTHPGKIGGVNGVHVEIGDTMICITDTPAGDDFTVGNNWVIVNTNIPGLSTTGVLFATMDAPAVASFPEVQPDGSIMLKTVSGGGVDLQTIWMNTGI